MPGIRLKARLAALEMTARTLSPTVDLIMPDGSIVKIPDRAMFECMDEVILAWREGRAPRHPYFDLIMKARPDSADGGSLPGLVQAEERSRRLYAGEDAQHGQQAGSGGEGDADL